MTIQEKELKLHEKANSLTLNELNQWFDEINDKIDTLEFSFTEQHKNALLAILNSKGLYSLDFKLAKSFLSVRKTLSDFSKINSKDLRVLQQILVSTRFSSPTEAEVISNAISAITEANTIMHELETELRIISTYITRAETEEATGLEFSEEDNENLAKTSVNSSNDEVQLETEVQATEGTDKPKSKNK